MPNCRRAGTLLLLPPLRPHRALHQPQRQPLHLLQSFGVAIRSPAGGRRVRGCAPVDRSADRHKYSRACARLYLCLGRDSNPHGPFGPRDFLTTMAFATVCICLWSGLFLHHGSSIFRCVVSSLCTFLLSKAWLKIAFSIVC